MAMNSDHFPILNGVDYYNDIENNICYQEMDSGFRHNKIVMKFLWLEYKSDHNTK